MKTTNSSFTVISQNAAFVTITPAFLFQSAAICLTIEANNVTDEAIFSLHEDALSSDGDGFLPLLHHDDVLLLRKTRGSPFCRPPALSLLAQICATKSETMHICNAQMSA